MKANQHLTLFAHKADRNARPVAVAPGRAFDGALDVAGLDLADVPQVVFHHALLHGDLGRWMQVLHLAAAAGLGLQAKVRALGAHALRGFAVDVAERALFKRGLAAVDMGAHRLKGQSTVNENHLAIGPVGHALGFQVEGFHFQPALEQGLSGF